ncbi:MAG: folylpolyglutamate synthase/dihydrofolate synthase family protein [Pseudomonadota bacterium]
MTPTRTEAVNTELALWLDRINTLDPSRVELGLSRIRAVLPRLGLGNDAITITVAGTNGKGSSVYWLDAFLRRMDLRVGRYTSPHLSSFNERIAVDGQTVSDAALVQAFEDVAAAQQGVELTYFEFTTLAALIVFANAAVDVQVLEVGLGGRLDAVNAVIPDACLLTGVDFDHQRWLGDSLEAIGREKAGIFRASVPAVIATVDPPSSVLEVAHAVGADVWLLGQDFEIANQEYRGRDRRASVALSSDNVATSLLSGVLATLESLGLLNRLSDADIAAVQRVRPPGRLEWFEGRPGVLLDVAHNPQSIGRLAQWLERSRDMNDTTLVFGAMLDKPIAEMLDRLAGVVDRWVAVCAGGERAMPADALGAMMVNVSGRAAMIAGSPVAGLNAARSRTPADGRIVVAGSFPVVGSVRAAL